MKGLLSIFMLVAALIAVTHAIRGLPNTPRPYTIPKIPGGIEPQTKNRFRRAPEDDKNKISGSAQKEGGKSAYNLEYERKLLENKYGSISANAGVNKSPNQKPQSHVGIGGSFSW